MSCPGCTQVLAHHHLTSPHTSQRQRQRQHQHHVVVCFCSSSPPFPPPSRFTVRFTQDPHVTHMSIALRRSQPSLPRFQPTLQCMLHKLSPPLAFRCGAECEDTHLYPSLKTRRILSLIQPRSLAFIAWSTFHICHNERSKCIRHKERNKRNYCTRVQMYLSLSQPQTRSRSFAVIASSSFQTQVLMSGKRK